MRMFAVLASMAMAMLASDAGRADTRVELRDTWPTGEAVTLGHGRNFYLRLHYTSDEPVHIWVQPYYEGKPAKAGANTSRAYPAGDGDALGWFFLFDSAAQVDEVRVSAGDGSHNRTRVVATYPVAVTAGETPADDTSRPDWVTSLAATDEAAQKAARANAANAPMGNGDLALMRGFMLAMLAFGLLGFAWPAWGLWRWRDGWRVAAVLPLLVMAFVSLRIAVDTARDPTSHNLWPFEIIMWGALACGWMLALTLARKLAGAGRAP